MKFKFKPDDVVIAKKDLHLVNGDEQEVTIQKGTRGEIYSTGFNTDFQLKNSYTVHFGEDPIVATFDEVEVDNMIAKAIKVRITGHTDPLSIARWWYTEHVGEMFEVFQDEEIEDHYYIYRDFKGKPEKYGIMKSDCEIVEDNA